MMYSAHEIASEPDLYNKVWKVGKYKMECFGYSKSGNTVRFGDIVPVNGLKVKLIIRYIHPDKCLELIES